MSRRIFILLAASATATATASMAQLHEEIEVDGRYIPEITAASRLPQLPSISQGGITAEPLAFITEGVTAGYQPAPAALPAPGWRDTARFSRSRGYLSLSSGSFLNTSLAAGVTLADAPLTKSGIFLRHYSTSLYRPKLSEATRDVRRYVYDQAIGAWLSHEFAGAGTLSADAYYRLDCFNYYGVTPRHDTPGAEAPDIPRQTVNDAAISLAWQPAASRLDYSASASLRWLSYAAYYTPDPLADRILRHKGDRELSLNIAGSLGIPTGAASSLSLGADINALFYPGHPEAIGSVDDYAMFTLTPAWQFGRGGFSASLGVRIDLTAKAGERADRYPVFHAAPDVTLSWKSNTVAVNATFGGGTQLQTLAGDADCFRYITPRVGSTYPQFNPLDARLSVLFGPFAGFSAGAGVAWLTCRHASITGWYLQWLSKYDVPTQEFPQGFTPLYDDPYNLDTRGVSVSLDLLYTWGDRLAISARGSWQPQHGATGYQNGLDRPRLTLDAGAEIKPLKPLSISLGYSLRAGRALYVHGHYDTAPADVALYRYRLPNISLLNLSAAWRFSPLVAVNINAANMLGRRTDFLPAVTTEGFALTAGVDLNF